MTVIMADLGLFVSCSKKPENVINHFQSLTEPFVKSGDHYIGKHLYHDYHLIEEISSLIPLVQAKWYLVQDVILDNNSLLIKDILQARQFINEAFKGIIKSLMLCDNARKERFTQSVLKYCQMFSKTVIPMCKLDDQTVVKIISTRNVSDCFFQYLHTYLDSQYFKLIIYCICGLSSENLEKEMVLLVKDLIKLCKINYEKGGQNLDSIFSCNCVKYFWLLVQLLLENNFKNPELFWKTFNLVLLTEDPLFSLIVVKNVAFLHCYNNSFHNDGVRSLRIKPNFQFLDIKLNEVLNQANSETLLKCFKYIEPLLNNLWLKEESLEIYSTIWIFYSKRLNVSNKTLSNISPYELNETLDTVLWSPKDCAEDFEMYVSLLIAHLREFPLHFNKMKGKIFTHTQGANKIKSLTENGIIHVVVLYMALGSLNHEAIEGKLINVLKEVTDEKYSALIWNLYSGLILKYVRDGRSIEKIAPQFAEKIQKASSDQQLFHLIKNFNLHFEKIIENSSSMHLHQWLLIGEWLPKYQAVCCYGDLTKSLEVILLLLNKSSGPDCWEFWEAKFHYFVYPSLRQLTSCSSPPGIIGKIAALLSLASSSLASDALKYFNSDSIPPKLSLEYLDIILDNYPEKFLFTNEQETLIIQSWVKICLLTLEPQLQKDFTKKVLKLDIFPQTLKESLSLGEDPILSFIEYLGANPKQYLRNPQIMKLVNSAFSNLDKILCPYLEKPQKEDITLKIYEYMSQIFTKCGLLIYSPNRSNTPLDRLVKILLLPDDLITGRKSPHKFILRAIKVTWPVFFQALNNNLNISIPLESMIVKYVPHFTTMESPLIKCLENERLAPMILQKLNKLYFGKPPYKETEQNTAKIIKILTDFVESTTYLSLFRLFLSNNLLGIFTAAICHPQRGAMLQLIKAICKSPFCEKCELEFQDAIIKLTDSCLAFEYLNYFQLMINLVRFCPKIIEKNLHYITGKVMDVEKKRGVGFDKSFRSQLIRLEQALENNI